MRSTVVSLLIVIVQFASVFPAEAAKRKRPRQQDDDTPAASKQDSAEPLSTGSGNKAVLPKPGAAASDLGFDFFAATDSDAQHAGTNLEFDPDKTAAKAATRRWMLKTHQILGITTWLLLGSAVVVGQLNYNQLYGGGGGSNEWQTPHRYLVLSASTAFAATGAFAIFAPTPYDRPLHFDTSLVHRLAAAGATLGMLTEIVLGITTANRANAGNPRDLKTLATAHQIIGYSTFGLLTVAGAVWVF
jgi:hypothetical protein